MTPSRLRGLLLAATALLGGLVLLAWSQPWFTLNLTAANGDPAPLQVGGDVAASALAPLALTTLALVAALAIAGPVFRVIMGVLETLVGLSVIAVTIVALTDPVAASASAVTEATLVTGSESVAALVAGVVTWFWPSVAIVLGAAIAVTGVVVTATASRWPVSGRKYSRTRTVGADAGTAADAAPDPVAEWDALSEGDDPTAPSR